MNDESAYKHLFPISVEVEQGKDYNWCGCGKSQTSPLCDKDNCGANSLLFKAELTEDAYLCNCKQTKNPPWCDGSHAKLLLEVVKQRQNK